MNVIRIFLASSAELDEDKEQVELFISRKNKDYQKKGIFLELTTWKDFISAMTEEHSQEKYNEYIKSCDIAIFLFHTKLGRFTRIEFETAHQAFLKSSKFRNKPLIYTFFKNDFEEHPEIVEFKNYIDSLEHFYDTYNSADQLFGAINRQLDKLEINGFIKSEKVDLRKIEKITFLYILPLLVVLLSIGFGIYYAQPMDMTVKVKEFKEIPDLPFREGKITISYDNKTERLPIRDEVIFKAIPSGHRGKKVHLTLEANGFITVDTILKAGKVVELPLKRDNSLGLIFGTVFDEKEFPISNATITTNGLSTKTDSNGYFRLQIPYALQKEEQRVTVFKEGYQTWDAEGAPSQNSEWKIILFRE